MSARRFLFAVALTAASLGTATRAAADPFTYDPPGQLVIGSGKGRVDMQLYAPGIRFPMESGPAYANSQVWGHGGGSGPSGSSQCDPENFSYPWHDNYCETRDWAMPLCPSGIGHQGQDIRASDCKKGVHWAVAVTGGTITSVGSYSVYLTAPDGTRFDYLHMQDVAVKEGQQVARGEHMGKVSNQFGGSATTVHLHFNIHQNVAGVGAVYVPAYLSLVKSYETFLSPPATDGGADAAAEPAKPPDVQVAPVTTGNPAEPRSDAASDGCTFAPSSTGNTSYGASFGVALAVAALGSVAARRRR